MPFDFERDVSALGHEQAAGGKQHLEEADDTRKCSHAGRVVDSTDFPRLPIRSAVIQDGRDWRAVHSNRQRRVVITS